MTALTLASDSDLDLFLIDEKYFSLLSLDSGSFKQWKLSIALRTVVLPDSFIPSSKIRGFAFQINRYRFDGLIIGNLKFYVSHMFCCQY